ncbi:MMPL family transporter [Paenibacillus agricola]|nr:MMPL family transporter [Paenibacillus agricola]
MVLWLFFLIFFGLYASKLPTVLKDHGLLADGAYVKVQQILATDFYIPADPVVLVFEKQRSVSTEQFQRFIQQCLLQLQGIEALSQVVSPLDKQDMLEGNYAYALLAFRLQGYEMKPVLEDIHRRLPSQLNMKVTMTGKSVVQADVNQASQHDLKQAELIGLPAAFLILWFVFRGIIAALIPVAIGIVGVTVTMGIMYGIGTAMELSNFVLNVIPMVGLALSIDFALMVVSRFREERERPTVNPVFALMTTMSTAGRAVLFSAASVFLGLMGILLIPLPIFTSIAVGAMTVVAISVLLTFTLLPALLAKVGSVIQPLTTYLRYSTMPAQPPTIWYAMSLYVMKRPARLLIVASLLLIGCFLPLSNMKLAIPDAASLPQGYESRQAYEIYQTHFVAPETSEVFIIVRGKTDAWSQGDWMRAYTLTQKLKADPDAIRVDSIFAVSPTITEPMLQRFVKGNHMLIHATIKGSPASEQTMDWVRRWEQEGATTGLSLLLGGEAKYEQEVFDAIFENLHKVLLFVIISNFVVLSIAFRSILIPLKTILMNLLSLGAAFGILVWIFQEGHLGMEPGSIAIMIPVFIGGLAFGISMDYGVFLVSRIFEVYKQTGDNDQAVLIGLAATSRIITSAAAIMIAVTAPFAFGEVVGVKQLGVGIAAAIFIDATIIRMVMVPALMKLLGKWNWWAPRRL